jgi:polyhydroxybutyrate depolymerase
MTADRILAYTGLASSSGPAVIIAAQGYERSWNAGGCCGPAWRANVNDVAFVRAALDATFASTPMADRSQVYAVGFSNGGRMAYRLACQMPGVLAGFAAVEAIPVVACPSMHPLNVTVVAQQADPLLTTATGAPAKRIYGTVEPTVPAELARLRVLDGCSSPGHALDAGTSVVTTWSCAEGATLRYVWYPGGGHSWRHGTSTTPGATAAVAAMLHPAHELVG